MLTGQGIRNWRQARIATQIFPLRLTNGLVLHLDLFHLFHTLVHLLFQHFQLLVFLLVPIDDLLLVLLVNLVLFLELFVLLLNRLQELLLI